MLEPHQLPLLLGNQRSESGPFTAFNFINNTGRLQHSVSEEKRLL